jgi:hypothetical protein
MVRTKKNLDYCKPSKRKNKISCYSKKALVKMTKAWNETYNDRLHDGLDSDQLWTNLNNKLSQYCNSELCWKNLDFIKNINENEIKKAFRPEMPKEWYSNPNAWLSTLDIDAVLYQYMEKHPEFEFLGTHPMDFAAKNSDGTCSVSDVCSFNLKDFINNNKTKIGLVLNLDKSHQSGSHWVCMFIDINLNKIYYWDSYGMEPEREVYNFSNKIKKQGQKIGKQFKFLINTYRHQYENSECGVYCLWFIIKLLESKNSFTEYNRIILKKVKDKIMEKNRNVLFYKIS